MYGGRFTVSLIPGDGVGAEVVSAVKSIFKTANLPIDWEEIQVTGVGDDDKHLDAAIESLKRHKVGLKGILITPMTAGSHKSYNVQIRKQLDIFAGVSLVSSIPGIVSRHKDINFAVIRENTEGEYSGLEHQPVKGVVESLKIMTEKRCERIARFAFDYAFHNGRKKVTCIHKANIMKLGDGLFLDVCRRVSQEYKHAGIEFDDMIVDNASMQMVSKPQRFDVLLLPNLYGTIVSNIGAGLLGSLALVPGANYGENYALFEPGARHTGRKIEGKNIANPTSMILSSCLLLRHLGLDDAAIKISRAVYMIYKDNKIRTPDLGGTNTGEEFVKQVLKNMETTFK